MVPRQRNRQGRHQHQRRTMALIDHNLPDLEKMIKGVAYIVLSNSDLSIITTWGGGGGGGVAFRPGYNSEALSMHL